ncbi:MAG: hypothetical protein IT383_07095 [Deltaproteobacteria bacterium]|nr:hypothetical protein [Deltaproteobacteria bacterium]
MAEHRRVEPRVALAGTGMATDVESVEELEGKYERRARAWREAPEKGFGAVLDEAEAQGELADEDHPDPRRRPKRPAAAPSEAHMAAAAAEAPPAAAPPPKPTPRAGPRVPPDPRAALLHKLLAPGAPKDPTRPGGAVEPQRIASTGTSTDTPPTGSAADRKPRP